jgi:hypothetical protein
MLANTRALEHSSTQALKHSSTQNGLVYWWGRGTEFELEFEFEFDFRNDLRDWRGCFPLGCRFVDTDRLTEFWIVGLGSGVPGLGPRQILNRFRSVNRTLELGVSFCVVASGRSECLERGLLHSRFSPQNRERRRRRGRERLVGVAITAPAKSTTPEAPLGVALALPFRARGVCVIWPRRRADWRRGSRRRRCCRR